MRIGSTVKNRSRSERRKRTTDEKTSVKALQSFVENPQTFLMKIALEYEVSRFSVHHIRKASKVDPYNIYLMLELSEHDFERRTEHVMENYERTTAFSLFFFNSWSNQNSNWMQAHTQHQQKMSF